MLTRTAASITYNANILAMDHKANLSINYLIEILLAGRSNPMDNLSSLYLQKLKDFGLRNGKEGHIPSVSGGQEDECTQQGADNVFVQLLYLYVPVQKHEVCMQFASDLGIRIHNLVHHE